MTRRDCCGRRMRAGRPASALLVALTGVLSGCGEPGPDALREPPSSLAANEIPRIPNLSELDPGFVTAVSDAMAAVDRDPSSGAAVGALGRLYQAHRYVDHARRCYERAQELDPAAVDWPYYLGFLAAGRGGHREAAGHFERALELGPSYWPARVRLGNALLAAGDFGGAEQAFRTARSAAPRAPWGELGLGKTARRRGRFETAAEHLRAALGA